MKVVVTTKRAHIHNTLTALQQQIDRCTQRVCEIETLLHNFSDEQWQQLSTERSNLMEKLSELCDKRHHFKVYGTEYRKSEMSIVE